MKLELLIAKVGHERFTPRKNKFLYSVFYVIMPITRLAIKTPRLFSFDRFNVFSIYKSDHGKPGVEWRDWIEEECARFGVRVAHDDTVLLISHPRIFGYAFNPISYWLIYERNAYVKAVLCEVHNTFGDDHNYLIFHQDGQAITPTDVFGAKKHLYVSPFNTVPPGSYTFTFNISEQKFKSVINYFENSVHILNTYMGGTRAPITDKSILWCVVRYPLMTLMVIFRIHYQAVRLYWKGMKHTLDTRPGPTSRGTTAAHVVRDSGKSRL